MNELLIGTVIVSLTIVGTWTASILIETRRTRIRIQKRLDSLWD